jgi:hypothetical protein
VDLSAGLNAVEKNILTPWPESAKDRRFSAKLVQTFADRGYHVVSVISLRPYSRLSRPTTIYHHIQIVVKFLNL